MTSSARRPPLAPPHDVIVPDSGSTTLRDLYGRYVSGVMQATLTFPAARLDRPTALELDRVRKLLVDATRRAPGVLPSLVLDPTFAVLVRCAQGELASGGATELGARLVRELAEAALVHLAFAGALPAEGVHLHRPVRSLASMPHDLFVAFDPPARGARFANGVVEATLETGPLTIDLAEASTRAAGAIAPGVTLSHPYPKIREQVALSLVDNNPLSMVELHPDKHGNAIDLGEHPLDEWRDTLEKAFSLVDRYAPEIAGEMRLMVRQIVPVGYDREKHLSASYAEAVGTIYMTLHPSLMTMTEALVHEYQHSKLNTLLYLDPLLENADYPLFTSPVRPDPRPLRGVLLAVHAFQPIARLYEAMFAAGDPLVAGEDAKRRYQRIAQINHAGCDVLLPNAIPTPIGQGVFDEMRRWDEHFMPVLDASAAHHARSEDP